MYVVSGCPRSGTSLMMDILREVFGEDRILGKKFNQETFEDKYEKQQENETDEQYSARMYVYQKNKDPKEIQKRKEKQKKIKNMNPNGFWEMLYTVEGCHYRFQDSDRLEKLLTEEKKSICKIVSQGLILSDPQYIDKIIYMVRHPRSVAKSQENLERQFLFSEELAPQINNKKIKIHSPEMYINVTTSASMWLDKYSDIDVIFVHFDDLISNPKETLLKIQDFLGEGDFEKAVSRINPKLKRSYPQEIISDFWEDAEFIYENFTKQNYKEIIDYMKDFRRAIHRKNNKIYCCRLGRTVIEDECLICMNSEQTRNNFKKAAKKRNIDWKNEPCIFECGYKDKDNISIEESIMNNFWKNNEDSEDKEININNLGVSLSDFEKMINFKS